MHKLRDGFERDLDREIALENARTAPKDPELASDWALKRELADLGAVGLPERVRTGARRSVAVSPRAPWLTTAAAALVVAVVVTLVLRSPLQPPSQAEAPVTPSARDLVELQLAFDTIHRAGRRAVAMAGREVRQSIALPELGLAELPYAGYVRPYFERPERS